MTSKRRPNPEQQAEVLLAGLASAIPPIDVEALARSAGAEIRRVDAPPSVSGALFREARRIIIGVNRQHHTNRQRFTIAHELGHLKMHLDRQLRLFMDEATVYFRDEVSSQAVDWKEIQANQFAAALLMPRQFLLRELAGKKLDINDEAVPQLAETCGVSVQALTLRLATLGLVDGFKGNDPGHDS